MKRSILIVDDEPLTRKSLFEILRHRGYKVTCAESAEEALGYVERDRPDIVITDLKMPGLDGMQLLQKVKGIDEDISVVLMTAFGSIENAVEAMKEGAYDYITKPIVDNEIEMVIERIFEQKRLIEENKTLKKKLADTSRVKFHGIIGQTPQMQKIYNLIDAVASTNATVLIQGESGTGKRMVACAVHSADKVRHDKPFIEVSCGALPENLLESELFGHVKGSFTSAHRDRQGRFEVADGGIIFLDEIDTFSPNLQVKLLRVLQEGEFERVGDTKTLKVNVKVVAATNQELKKLITEGKFREDLYYRLNVIPIHIPPLRERKGDLPLLLEHFLEKCSKRNENKKICDVSEEVMSVFFDYDWPGNIRELENIVERAVILCKGDTIVLSDLPDSLQNLKTDRPVSFSQGKVPLKEALKFSERNIIERVLSECGGNRTKAAELLGINRTTLYNKMKEYGFLDEE